MKFRRAQKLAMVQVAVLTALMLTSRSNAAVLDVSIAGYYGSNFLADKTSALPNGTTVDFGLFYSNGFTSASAITTALGSVNSLAGMQAFRSSNGWISFATTTVQANDFSITMTAYDSTGLNMTPTTGTLTGLNLTGATAFLWIETSGSTSQFGVYSFKTALPTMSGFADFLPLEATSNDVTSIVGSANPDGVSTATVNTTTPTVVPPVLVLKSRGTPALNGSNTSVTHRFAVNVPGTYNLDYTSNLAAGWTTTPLVVSSTSDFDVTLTNPGINSVSEWTNRMFFRIRNI
jgi:hypothetical protein